MHFKRRSVGVDVIISAEMANRLKRIEAALSAQRVFIDRVPDPNTRANGHLITLVQTRNKLLQQCELPAA